MLTRSPSKKGASTDFPAYELEPVPVTEAICEALGVVPEYACIVPYWCKVLGREDITAYQASEREGYLYCREKIERVLLSGQAVLYSQSEILEEDNNESD